jgi:hypothetical protein
MVVMPDETRAAAGAEKRSASNNLFEGSRPGLGGLGREFMDFAALRACRNLGILVGHFVQEVGKCLPAVLA